MHPHCGRRSSRHAHLVPRPCAAAMVDAALCETADAAPACLGAATAAEPELSKQSEQAPQRAPNPNPNPHHHHHLATLTLNPTPNPHPNPNQVSHQVPNPNPTPNPDPNPNQAPPSPAPADVAGADQSHTCQGTEKRP